MQDSLVSVWFLIVLSDVLTLRVMFKILVIRRVSTGLVEYCSEEYDLLYLFCL